MDASAEQVVGWSERVHGATALAVYRGLANAALAPGNETRLGLAELWRGLMGGEYRVLESSYTEEHCLTRVQRVRQPVPLKRARAATLQRVLLGESQKVIAIEQGVAVSSVTGACSDCLAAAGGGRWTSRAPIWFSLAAHASAGRHLPDPKLLGVRGSDARVLELAFPRPDLSLKARLTRAEYGVVRPYLEGDSHVGIASRCHTAPRTVANQLASVFRKLAVAGRGDLLSWLIREQWPG